jgi:hypothetical protein
VGRLGEGYREEKKARRLEEMCSLKRIKLMPEGVCLRPGLWGMDASGFVVIGGTLTNSSTRDRGAGFLSFSLQSGNEKAARGRHRNRV